MTGAQARLARLLDERRPTNAPGPVRLGATTSPPSFGQESLWFLDQLDADTPIWNVPLALRVRGGLDVPVLARALAEVVRRHEVLRSVFGREHGELAMRVQPGGPIDLPAMHVREEGELDRLLLAETRRAFQLDVGPLARFRLFRVAADDHVLAVTLHHAVADGWSIGVLTRELAQLYDAFLDGRPSPLPELPLQYSDYAAWQRQLLASGALDCQIAHWRTTLSGRPDRLRLPTDRPRPDQRTLVGARHHFTLPAALTEELRRLCKREGITTFMAVLSAYQFVLARWSGQNDILVGTGVAGRTYTGLEPLIGFFVNTLVLRSSHTDDPTVRQYLHRTRDTALAAYANQDLPFDRLVQEVEPRRSLSHSPLVQAMLTLLNEPTPEVRLGDADATLIPLTNGCAKQEISVILQDGYETLAGTVSYAADIFDRGTIRRFVEQMQRVLEQFVADAERRVSALGLASPMERERLLVELNASAAPTAQGLLHELFEAQVEPSGERTAVRCGGDEISYADLEARSNQVAHSLRARSVGPESVVGVCLDRSIDLVVGLLGVLKAGGAYLPLDPAYPDERLRLLAEDSGAALVLTRERWLERFAGSPADVIALERERGLMAQCSTERIESPVTADNLAYVIYTSGSTGAPKGVLITHRAVSNYVDWCADAYGVSDGAGTVVHSSISFDATVTGLFGPLVRGATLFLVPDADGIDGLADALRGANGFSYVKVTPSHLSALSRLIPAAELAAATRTLIVGGERLVPSVLERWFEHAPGTRIVNSYGPTEATVNCASFDVPPKRTFPDSVPIGGPIANMTLYVLDAGLNPVPPGVVGELCVGGVGIARGYQRRPALTAAAFVPDPFAPAPGARMYRTGDAARYLANDEIEVLGRRDRQVKIRGHRVELGEIESVLRAHAAVAQAVATIRGEGEDAQLVAYVTGVGPPPAEEIRQHLAQQLPAAAVPSHVVVVDALPLNRSGKVDLRALPDPETVTAAGGSAAPRTAVEEILCGIWEDVLDIPTVGVEANFFELGGHSLLATQLVSRIRDSLDAELPLRTIFEAPTVAALASRLDGTRSVPGTKIACLGRTVSELSLTQEPLVRAVIPARDEEGNAGADRLRERLAAYNVPVALRIGGELEVAVLARALEEVVRRHEVLRSVYRRVGGVLMMAVQPAEPVELPINRVSGGEAELEQLLLTETRCAFELDGGSLTRFALFRLAPDDHLLSVTLHHSVADGWSTGLFVRELATVYEALVAHRAFALPELPLQYSDYAAWQRQLVADGALDHQLDHWCRTLADLPRCLHLPTDRPRPPQRTLTGARHQFTLGTTLTDTLRRRCQREGITMFIALLSAYHLLLERWSGQPDMIIGTGVAGRIRTELEPLIGFFVNTLLLRNEHADDLTVQELLHQTRETALSAYAHQDIPFAAVNEALNAEAAARGGTLSHSYFMLQNLSLPADAFTSLAVDSQHVRGPDPLTTLDLEFEIVQRRDHLACQFVYATDIYDSSTIAGLAVAFEDIAKGIASSPHVRANNLPWRGV